LGVLIKLIAKRWFESVLRGRGRILASKRYENISPQKPLDREKPHCMDQLSKTQTNHDETLLLPSFSPPNEEFHNLLIPI
jgi:hypothetical protein